MANPILMLAGHAAGWRGRPIPPPLAHAARRALVDWFGCLLAGRGSPPATLLARALAEERGPGRAVSYVEACRAPVRHAALLNAAASHTVEFDDIHRDSGFHPACPTISAALAVAQAKGRSLDDLLRAVIAGYEVSCRIGLAVMPSHYRMWHITGTVGTFGAATAAAVLLDCDADQCAHALATAATTAGGLQQAFRGAGMSKPMHPAHAAEAGTLAALAVGAGVTGALDVLHGPVGFAAATSDGTGDWLRALDGLGERYAIAEMTFKNHGCCGHIHAPLDAVALLQARHGLRAADVERIEVEGYAATQEVCDRPVAATEQEARFSAQFCLATQLLHGGVRLSAFGPDRLADPALKALMDRISVRAAPDLVALYPGRRAARVTVTLRNGRTLFHEQPTRKGDPDAPLSDDELSAKFLELASPALGSDAPRFLRSLWTGNELPGELALPPLDLSAPAHPQ